MLRSVGAGGGQPPSATRWVPREWYPYRDLKICTNCLSYWLERSSARVRAKVFFRMQQVHVHGRGAEYP
jgi:hypothetical protein